MKDDILEFAKKYPSFKPTSYQEAFLKMKSPRLLWWNRNPYKRTIVNEFAYEKLATLKVGQKFGLATPKGFFVYQRKKVIKPKPKIFYDEYNEIAHSPKEE